MENLARVLEPLSVETFFDQFWRRMPLFIPESKCFDNILTVDEINDYFKREGLFYPFVRLVENGTGADFSKYKLISDGSFNIINKSIALKLFTEGNTFVLQGTQFQFTNIRKFISSLESELGTEINANVYITPANSKGFWPHFDNHEVIALQISGIKTWNIYHDIPIQAPIKGELTETQRTHYQNTDALHKVKLLPGNVLYIPRGVVHDAYTDDEVSIHVTLGFNPLLRIDIISQLFKRIENTPYFREPFSSMKNDFNTAAAGTELLDKIGFELSEVLKNLSEYRGYEIKYLDTSDLFANILLIDNLHEEEINNFRVYSNMDLNTEYNLTDLESQFLHFIRSNKLIADFVKEKNISLETIKMLLKTLVTKSVIKLKFDMIP